MQQKTKRGAFASSAGTIGTHILNINPQVNLSPPKEEIDLWIEKNAAEIFESFYDLYKAYGKKLEAKVPNNRFDVEVLREKTLKELPEIMSINLIQDKKTKKFFFTRETLLEDGMTVYMLNIETSFTGKAKELWLDFLSIMASCLPFEPIYNNPDFQMMHEMYLEEQESLREECTLHETFRYYLGENNMVEESWNTPAIGEGAKIIDEFLKRNPKNFEDKLNRFKPKGDDEKELKKNLNEWYPVITGFNTNKLLTMENHPYITPEEYDTIRQNDYKMSIWDNFIITAGMNSDLTDIIIEYMDNNYNSGVEPEPIIEVQKIKRKGNKLHDNAVQNFFETIDQITCYSQRH